MSPRPRAEALGEQLVPQVAERVGFTVVIRGDGDPAGCGEVGAVDAAGGQPSAQAGDFCGQSGMSDRASSTWRHRSARVGDERRIR